MGLFAIKLLSIGSFCNKTVSIGSVCNKNVFYWVYISTNVLFFLQMLRNVKKWPFQTTCSKTAFFKRTVHFWVCFQTACLQLILFTNQLFALDLLTNDLLNISSSYYVKNCLLYYFFQLFLLPQETCLHHPGGLFTIFYL